MLNIKISRLVEDADTVILDSGTAYYLASELVKKEEEVGF